jgi:hypothetical protein
MVDKGFGAKQYQKTTLASNPKRDYYNLAQKGGGGRAPSGFTYDYKYLTIGNFFQVALRQTGVNYACTSI